MSMDIHPLTPERWPDVEALFEKSGNASGCWCMWWRVTRSQFDQQTGEDKKRAFQSLVEAGRVPGILAYVDGKPAAWCAVEPRERYPSLERSPILKRVDNQPVWSITCFFVAKPFRKQGLMILLLEAAIAYARRHGATIIEGYPVEPKTTLSSASAYTGVASAFRRVGFSEVARRSETRSIMRYNIVDQIQEG